MSDFAAQKAVYNGLILPLAYGLARAAAPFHAKLRETLRGQRGLRARWITASERFSERPVWFHVASVGEYEQARPVITALHEAYPHVPVAITITSPSGYHYARRKEALDDGNNVRFVDYLPLDFSWNTRFCLDSLAPRLLVFVKFDLWPNLIWQASSRGIRSILIDATLSETSYRVSAPGRRFYRAVYENLGDILAISQPDAERFAACVPGHSGIRVTGDTRFDRVMERKSRLQDRGVAIERAGRLVLLAGSTWPKDEAHVLGALARIAAARDDLVVVLAPHEPTEDRVQGLLAWAAAVGLHAGRFTSRDAAQAPRHRSHVIVVDTVGVLAELYGSADVAYVGGSFSTGVHSVIEPAIMGIPVAFGPVHKNSFEALELVRRGAACAVAGETDLLQFFERVLNDDKTRRSMGARAREYVESQLGATARCMETISNHI